MWIYEQVTYLSLNIDLLNAELTFIYTIRPLFVGVQVVLNGFENVRRFQGTIKAFWWVSVLLQSNTKETSFIYLSFPFWTSVHQLCFTAGTAFLRSLTLPLILFFLKQFLAAFLERRRTVLSALIWHFFWYSQQFYVKRTFSFFPLINGQDILEQF